MKEIISYGRFRCRELSPHKNRGMEITYIEKGFLEWFVEGAAEKVGPGTVFFTLPWQVHGSLNPTEPENTVWHVLFHLEKDYPEPHEHFAFPARFGFTASETHSLSSVFAGTNRHGFRATPALHWLMSALIDELQSTHELRPTHAISLLRALLVELKRVVSGDAIDTEIHTWAERKVQVLLTTLSSTCHQPWTLKQMAAESGVQRTRINTLFKKLSGCTPMEYLRRLRMERAKTLLRETGSSITNIAFDCGFGSSQYFAKTFRKATGMTPGEYRSRCAGLSAEDLRKWAHVDFRTEQEEIQRVRSFSA